MTICKKISCVFLSALLVFSVCLCPITLDKRLHLVPSYADAAVPAVVGALGAAASAWGVSEGAIVAALNVLTCTVGFASAEYLFSLSDPEVINEWGTYTSVSDWWDGTSVYDKYDAYPIVDELGQFTYIQGGNPHFDPDQEPEPERSNFLSVLKELAQGHTVEFASAGGALNYLLGNLNPYNELFKGAYTANAEIGQYAVPMATVPNYAYLPGWSSFSTAASGWVYTCVTSQTEINLVKDHTNNNLDVWYNLQSTPPQYTTGPMKGTTTRFFPDGQVETWSSNSRTFGNSVSYSKLNPYCPVPVNFYDYRNNTFEYIGTYVSGNWTYGGATTITTPYPSNVPTNFPSELPVNPSDIPTYIPNPVINPSDIPNPVYPVQPKPPTVPDNPSDNPDPEPEPEVGLDDLPPIIDELSRILPDIFPLSLYGDALHIFDCLQTPGAMWDYKVNIPLNLKQLNLRDHGYTDIPTYEYVIDLSPAKTYFSGLSKVFFTALTFWGLFIWFAGSFLNLRFSDFRVKDE